MASDPLGELIRRALRDAPFAMRQLAADSGLSYDVLRSWRSGRRRPSRQSAERLAAGLERRGNQLQQLARELRDTADSGAAPGSGSAAGSGAGTQAAQGGQASPAGQAGPTLHGAAGRGPGMQGTAFAAGGARTERTDRNERGERNERGAGADGAGGADGSAAGRDAGGSGSGETRSPGGS